jgi:hypothetical protein
MGMRVTFPARFVITPASVGRRMGALTPLGSTAEKNDSNIAFLSKIDAVA